MTEPAGTRVLMVYPRFGAESFWNYTLTSELLGARYPTIPLGLITVAAMLPKEWSIRLINRNTEELRDEDIAWADLVMTGGMINQQFDALEIVRKARAMGKISAVGGPDATSSPHVYAAADFRVIGEAEGIIDKFVEAWEAGARAGVFEAPKFQADVTKSPIPRFDLLKFQDYLFVGVQFSRGCPFTCEFCDIIELYGRVPRTKATPQILAELDRLYELGYRGHVDFVDDNLVGNRKSLRAFLPALLEWQRAHGFPFEFSTEASINLADDLDLLKMMRACGFFALFVGIESPDEVTLAQTSKKQNTRRSLVESVNRIYDAGMFITAGFILGFDSEQGSVARPMTQFIEEAAIPVSMVGLLYALPNTQLTRRLVKEGRLYQGHDLSPETGGDQCARGLNYETLRPRRDILADYKSVLETIYDPEVYCARVVRVISRLNLDGAREAVAARRAANNGPSLGRSRTGDIEAVYKVVNHRPELRDLLWKTFQSCMAANPMAGRQTMTLLALYLHLGQFARLIIAGIDEQIAEIDAGAFSPPPFVEQLALTA